MGQLDEAITEYRTAIELNPKGKGASGVHTALGLELQDKGQLNEAVAEHRTAIELDPSSALAYTNLSGCLWAQGQLAEATAASRKAIEIDPLLGLAHNNLAYFLMESGDLAGAMRSVDEALRLNGPMATVIYNRDLPLATRAEILLVQGGFAEAVLALERAVIGLRKSDPRMAITYEGLLPKARWLVEQARILDALSAPDTSGEPTMFDIAARARAADRPALAARLADVAMTALPAKGNDLEAGHRYAAARAAALASTDGGHDDPALEERAKTELRQLALNWLRADLALLAQQLRNADPAARDSARAKLRDWQQAQDLAGIRDEAALGKLPEAERAVFTQLWAHVESLSQNADQP